LVEGKSYLRDRPEYIPYSVPTAEPDSDPRDYKVRKKNKLNPTIYFDFSKITDTEIRSEALYHSEEILRLAKLQGATVAGYHFSSDMDKDKLLAKWKEKDVDAVLIPERTEENRAYSVKVKDPIRDHSYGELNFQWKLESEPKGAEGSETYYFWNLGGTPKLIQNLAESYQRLVIQPSSEDWQNTLGASVRGKVNVYSSSSDTKILLDGRPVGNTPLVGYSMLNGPHRIQFMRTGQETVTKFFQLRAGDERTFFHEWKDDQATGNLRILTYPSGFNIFMDGERKGEAQLFLSEIPPGEYQVQFSKNKNGEEIQFASGIARLNSSDALGYALPIQMDELLNPSTSDFWFPSGRTGFRPRIRPRLEFSKDYRPLVPGDYGFYTSHFPSDEIDITGRFINPVDSKSGRYSLFVEIGNDLYLYDCQGEEIAFYHFGPSLEKATSLHVWKFKKNDPEEERPFRIRSKHKSQEVEFVLGNKTIYETKYDLNSSWRMGILTRGESFFQGQFLRTLQIQYPDLIQLLKQWEDK
jgi:hypothetical protein